MLIYNAVGAIYPEVMCLPNKNGPLQKKLTLCIDATLGGPVSKLSGKLMKQLIQCNFRNIGFEHKC